jgi:hypothetical protein
VRIYCIEILHGLAYFIQLYDMRDHFSRCDRNAPALSGSTNQ